MKKVLSEIVEIKTGIYKRPDPMGTIYYIQAQHITRSGDLEMKDVKPKLSMNGKLEKHLLKSRDLLLVAKGERNMAALYSDDIGNAVASSSLFVLRIKVQDVLAEYLKWFINSSMTRKKLKSFLKGSYIPSISKQNLKTLEVRVPSLEKQKEILYLDKLWNNEKMLYKKLVKQKEDYYQNLLLEISKE